jgi:hypothetical protein
MPTTSPPDRIRAFLAEPQPAVIASVRPDGQPVSVATWYLLDGDEVLVTWTPVAADWPTCDRIRGSA